jgi:hypothetical protein
VCYLRTFTDIVIIIIIIIVIIFMPSLLSGVQECGPDTNATVRGGSGGAICQWQQQ